LGDIYIKEKNFYMSIDLKKYDNVKFHENEDVDKKIRAYMFIFDYVSFINKLADKEKVDLFDEWEKVFLLEEFYEIIPSIQHRRKKLKEKMRRDKLSVVNRMARKLSDIIQKLKNNKK
jgi:hypothetical protein